MAKFKNSPESILGRIVTLSFVCIAALFLIGLILFFLPKTTNNKIVGILAGIGFLISGVEAMYIYMHREGAKIFSLNMVFAIIFFVLAGLIVVIPYQEMKFPLFCLGLYLAVSGGMRINYGYWLKRGNEDGWLVTLVSGILLIIFAFMVWLAPFKIALGRIAGTFLMVNAVVGLSNTLLFKNNDKNIMDIFW